METQVITLADPNARKIRADALRMARAEGYHYSREHWHFGPGRFEGEAFPIAYFYDAVMNGMADETLQYPDAEEVDFDLITLSDWERAAFNEPDAAFAAIGYSSQGFLSLSYLTEEEADQLRAEYAPEED